jgi:hypothetical protein
LILSWLKFKNASRMLRKKAKKMPKIANPKAETFEKPYKITIALKLL